MCVVSDGFAFPSFRKTTGIVSGLAKGVDISRSSFVHLLPSCVLSHVVLCYLVPLFTPRVVSLFHSLHFFFSPRMLEGSSRVNELEAYYFLHPVKADCTSPEGVCVVTYGNEF